MKDTREMQLTTDETSGGIIKTQRKFLASSLKPANIRPFPISDQPANWMTKTQ